MRQVKHFVFVVFCICNLLATCFSVKQWEDSGHREESATCSIPTETDSTPATCSAPSTTVSEVPNHNAEFVATNDWQELLQGQSVPPGLHVRVNLQTGKREAKLLDANEKEADNAAVLVDSPDEGSEGVLQTSASAVGEVKEDHEATDKSYDNVEILNESESFVPKEPDWNHEKMYELLNSLPEPPKVGNMDINEAQKKLSKDEFRREIIRLWKNRQADLKLALDALQNDSKYQGELIDSFHEAGLEGKVEEQLVILEKLEWEVQDLDKTHIFHYIGGFDFVLEQLNASDLRIAASACWVIGTACKYYDDAQVWAIDAGVMPRLLQQLAVESSITSDNQDQQLSIWEARKKALYAITSIMRSQDRARKLFLQFDGERALGQFFGGSAPYNVQIKALFLVHDTLVEAESKKSEIASHPALSKLDEAFKTGEWCERVVNFYETFHENLVPSHLIEALETLTAQADMCSSVFQQAKLRAQLDKQIANWEKMKLAESDEELTHVLKAARTLIETLKSSETSHEEL